MLKKYVMLLVLFAVFLTGCVCEETTEQNSDIINAAERGLSTENSGALNSQVLQALIDEVALSGKTVYIPAGEYEFAENGTQTIGSHCIKMRSGVSIVGDGEKTVLKPIGRSRYGLDMFYFNEYLDTGEAIYLENCSFERFLIDASGTSCEVYTSAGKGFMFNLFKNCHFREITVKNTDATGFGVDCPIDCTITACTAIGCGKAATYENGGASGFGIGYGYGAEEGITISDCVAKGNKKFGFFLEHQGRFDNEKYAALPTGNFTVKNCFASANLFGYGGINAFHTVYEDCVSENSHRFGFYFENSFGSGAKRCKSRNEKEVCFAVLQDSDLDDIFTEADEIYFFECEGESSAVGLLSLGEACPALQNCTFDEVQYEIRSE